jgi:hypothetical protein
MDKAKWTKTGPFMPKTVARYDKWTREDRAEQMKAFVSSRRDREFAERANEAGALPNGNSIKKRSVSAVFQLEIG